jgi:AraC-like DNA-binding protein
MALRRSSDVWAREFTPLRVGFAHEAPPDVSVYEGFFGCPVRFDAGVNELVFSPAVWRESIEVGNPDLSAILERYAEDILSRLPRGGELLPRVRSALSDELRGGDPTQTVIAKKLGLSPRTLQRRLKDEGATFAQLLDDVRTEAAKVLLADANLSVGEVGLLLGFFDHGSFTRAFRGWTGQTPSAWRLSQAL